MLLKFFLFFFIFFNYSLNLHADQKQLIINRLLEIDNITFSFNQTTAKKTETGTCFLVFDNKLKCSYLDKNQKEIIINNKKLVIIQKRYNKIYSYPVSKSPFVKILSKNSLIKLVKESDIELSNNISLTYLDENEKKIIVLFEKKNYNIAGWQIQDRFQNQINFSLKIQRTNTEVDDDLFEIPSIN